MSGEEPPGGGWRSLQGESGWQGGEGGDRSHKAEPHPGPRPYIPPNLPAPPAVTHPTLPDLHLSHPQPPNAWSHHPILREPSDLEELEKFAAPSSNAALSWVSHRSEAACQDRRRDPLVAGGVGPRYLVAE